MAINLSNIRLFLWEEGNNNAILHDEGIFLFNFITNNNNNNVLYFNKQQPLCLATTFKLQNLENGTIPYHLFSNILAKQGIVPTNDQPLLAIQVSNFILSTFRFHGFEYNSNFLCSSSRLVFVLDIVSDLPLKLLPLHQSPSLLRSQMYTLNIGLPNLPHKLFQQNQEVPINSPFMMSTLYGPLRLPHERMAPRKQQLTDCLHGDEVDNEELNHVLASLNNVFNNNNNNNLKEDSSAPCTSVHEILHKVRPTIYMENKTKENTNGNNEDDDDIMCSICLDKILEESQLRKMVRCKHVFHDGCIFKWLPKKQSCPYCRTSSTIDVYL